ncbi:MAG: chromate transporter, partial [Bacillota bacterium]|nr:chromate transporter [Bacillota bacterium]
MGRREKKKRDNSKAERQATWRSVRQTAQQYLGLFWEFFKIGLFTIGGGMAMIPQIQQVAVKDKKWLSEEEM